MALSLQQRQALGLDDPAPGEDEFDQPPLGTSTPPVRTRNLRLILDEAEKATPARIRQMVNDLLAGNMDNANYALQQLFAANPKVALETYIELAKFALPQLKAVAVAVEDRSDNPRAFSFAELQKVLAAE